ncbi:PAS domain-containing protein [Spirosoma sp. BT702]|uniref:histidine kinase n=1 Tax=Spirosoma profusum TaxID=2771354 RepID=A0A926Y2W3_9BACT|nr:ATP-binding protein [Spirosoma profusum]MBD2703442.1 PAS domain-containing protein [Spirosoma profusum]
MLTASSLSPTSNQGFLSGGGELGQLIRSFDWSQTPLGAVDSWPQSLRSALSICLNSNFPIAIYWGKELHLLYNDAWSPIPGNKHPWALGRTARQVWPEIWEQIEPQFALAFSGQPGGSKDALLPMQRHGYTEECYFDFTFTPIYGEAGTVEGVFNAVIETTYRVISERRTTFLKQLAIQLARATTSTDVYQQAIHDLKTINKDIAFACLYTQKGSEAPLLFASTDDSLAMSNSLLKSLPFEEVSQAGHSVLIPDLTEYLSGIPRGFWAELPMTGILVPLKSSMGSVEGFLFCGLSPRLSFDEDYALFIESVASAMATVVSNIASLEAERKRAEALAEIDRTKTTFFANISHEFRTPLTLLLGPIEDMLTAPQLDPAYKSGLEVMHRNALRMQKLVNTLLDFSKIEAGRAKASFQAVAIGALTAELASSFRSAIEKAGMQLLIHSEPILGEVYLDVDMWEKIVLNLVSNAFKYTQQGHITLTIRAVTQSVEVVVADTGVGIAQDQLDNVFNRFYRIENGPSRSQEGTGIGLAMVKELVKLHGGSIHVSSQPGKGSVFTITLPMGKAHLPLDQLAPPTARSSSTQSAAYVQEALRWNGSQTLQEPIGIERVGTDQSHQYPVAKPTVLLADDNADMRDYIERLLGEQFVVLTAMDGQDALTKLLQHKPDLLITDVMMPNLDGFGLLNQVRAHPELKSTPVIFLSARAGDEAKVEGLNAGADDYLVKPFSAKELIVRVANHIRINQIRRATEQQFYQLFLQAPTLINVFKGPDHRYEIFHPLNKAIFGEVDFTGMTIREALPELEGQGIVELLDEVYQTGKRVEQQERAIEFLNKDGKKELRILTFSYQPWYDLKGHIQGVLNVAIDVTRQVTAQQTIEKSAQNLRAIFAQSPVAMTLFRGSTQVVDIVNERMLTFWGKTKEDVLGKSVFAGLPELKGQGFEAILDHVYTTGEPYSAIEHPVILVRNGQPETVYVNFAYEALREPEGTISGVMAVALEVTEQVLARKTVEEAETKARLAIESAELGTYELNLRTNELTGTDRFYQIWGASRSASRQQLATQIHPADQSIRQQAHQALARTGKLHYEIRVQGEDGQQRWVRLTGKQLYDPPGNPVTLLGVVQDITEQKQFAQLLSQQVQQRTLELQQSNEDLQQFAHVASHDLKEPVRKVKLFSTRLEEEYGDLLPQKAQLFVEKIQRSADRMLAMIQGVLSYSSLTGLSQQPEQIDLMLLLEQIETDLEVLMLDKQAQINKQAIPDIEGTPVLIYQLFYNLINNALKFAKATEPPIITISTVEADEQLVKILVADNGIGFDQQHAGRVFETFTRLHAKDAYEGTGLGLALCKKIVERHRGTITVQSVIKQGSTFIITLPRKQTFFNKPE